MARVPKHLRTETFWEPKNNHIWNGDPTIPQMNIVKIDDLQANNTSQLSQCSPLSYFMFVQFGIKRGLVSPLTINVQIVLSEKREDIKLNLGTPCDNVGIPLGVPTPSLRTSRAIKYINFTDANTQGSLFGPYFDCLNYQVLCLNFRRLAWQMSLGCFEWPNSICHASGVWS